MWGRTANASNFAPTSPTLVALTCLAMSPVIEHEPDVAVDVPVQTRRVDGLFYARHAIRGCQLIVEIDHTD